MRTSKAFRGALPTLRDDQLTHLARWAALHCAQSSIFRGERGSVVLVGLTELLRASASFHAPSALLCAASASMCRCGGVGSPSSRQPKP